MSEAFSDTPPAFLSTGAVARILGLKPDEVRAMVESGQLPRPQLMAMGRRTERVYSQEWVVLADEAENARRLEGLESWLPPDDVSQFVIRLDQTAWTLQEMILRLTAINNLWLACLEAVGVNPSEAPEVDVRRLSVGSPLDVLLWVGGLSGVGGTAVWLMRTAINSPEKLVGLIPRISAGWNNSKADQADAQSRRILSEIHLDRVRAAREAIVGDAGADVSAAISGPAAHVAEIEQVRSREIESALDTDLGADT